MERMQHATRFFILLPKRLKRATFSHCPANRMQTRPATLLDGQMDWLLWQASRPDILETLVSSSFQLLLQSRFRRFLLFAPLESYVKSSWSQALRQTF